MQSVELCGWAVLLAALAYWADVIAASKAGEPLGAAALMTSISGAGAFNAAAWLMVATRCRTPAPRLSAPASLVLLALVSGLLCIVPIALALAPALVLLGLSLALHPALPPSRREAGWLLLGLGVSWGWPFLRFAHLAVGRVDARVIETLEQLRGVDVGAQGNIVWHGNFAIEILPACASSYPLAEVALAYAVVAMFCRHRLALADLVWLAASLLYSIALTEIRLCLMAPSWADWNWWHNGPGVTVYELAALAGAAFIPWAAARRAASRRAAISPSASRQAVAG
jgi:hypothetical protein